MIDRTPLQQLRRFQRNAGLAALVWSVILGISLAWNIKNETDHALQTARKVAGSTLAKDLAFRDWLLQHNLRVHGDAGGDDTPPALDCLAALEQFIGEFSRRYGVLGRFVSPSLPGKYASDAWEQKALEGIIRFGAQEVYEATDMDGTPYMRLMRPLYAPDACFRHQPELEEGELVGALSITVPMRADIAYRAASVRRIGLSHALFWLTGIGVIAFLFWRGWQRYLERIQAEEKLRQAAKVFESTSEGVIVTDAENKIITVNQAFTLITGYAECEVTGQDPRLLRSDRHDQAFFQTMWDAIRNTGQWHGEIWNRRKNGEVYPEWLNIGVIRDQQGKLTNYVGVFSDITAIKESENRLNYLAHHDPLTGLPNRLLFNARLEHAIQQARRRHLQVGVLFVDLDRFKNINETLGHPAGDAVVKLVAERLQEHLREEDTLARPGGDEFIILADALHAAKDAAIVARKLLNVLSQPFSLSDHAHELFITASMGISLYPSDGQDCATLIKNADIALYRAKQQGRNNYQFYTEDLTDSMFERFTLESQLRRALERNELVLYYQPQVDVARERIIGVEALIRWQHPERGLLSPGHFITLADEMGLLTSIGEWVLNTACRQGKSWHDMGLPPLRMAVNLSAYQVMRSDVIGTVKQALETSGFDPATLELEITEDFFMQGDTKTLAVLYELKSMGISLAIDDFGTGYSSLSYLKRFPIDRLKIDQSFIRDIPQDADDEAIARAIIAIGHSLKLTVIAEGVETEAQHHFLKQQNCDEMQGFLCSPALPAEYVEELLRRPGSALGEKPDASA